MRSVRDRSIGTGVFFRRLDTVPRLYARTIRSRKPMPDGDTARGVASAPEFATRSGMRCESCGTQNPTGQRFCGQCGAALTLICGSCGATNQPSQRYCGACGTSLPHVQGDAAAAAGVPRAAPTTERRLVSVLFADLVGFTTFSESRDPEEVRDLLSRYFDASRQIVGRYGGIV